MPPLVFDALRAAVTIARQEQVQTVARLRKRLLDLGYSEAVITEALSQWKARITL